MSNDEQHLAAAIGTLVWSHNATNSIRRTENALLLLTENPVPVRRDHWGRELSAQVDPAGEEAGVSAWLEMSTI